MNTTKLPQDTETPAVGVPVECSVGRPVEQRADRGTRPPGDGKRRAERSKASRAAQGYDNKPPRCGECVHFVPCGHKRGGRWQPPTCAIGGFAIESFGICDRWQGANGETLEK
jgi:hypothetical protein